MKITPYSDQYWPSLQRFLAESYPEAPFKSDRRYFQWRFAGSPLGSSLEGYLLLVEQGRVVGQVATLRDRLWAGGAWRDCYWLVDLMVSPDRRRGTAGIELFQAAMRACPTVLSVGFSERTSALHRGLKWQWAPGMTSRFAVVRPSRLADLAGSGVRPWPLAAALRVSDGIVRPLQAARTRIYRRCLGKLQVEAVDRFDSRFDELLDRALDWNMVQPFRSSATLAWKFGARPCGAHFTLVAREPRSAAIRGYMIVKLKSRPGLARWGDIADFVVGPGDAAAFRALFNEALGQAISRGADLVRIRYSGKNQIPPGVALPGIGHQRPTDAVACYSRTPGAAADLSQRPWALTGIVSDLMDYGADEWDGANAGSRPASLKGEVRATRP